MIVMHITWEHLWVYFGAMRGDTLIQPQSIISTFRNLCMSSHKSNMPVVNFTLGVRVFVYFLESNFLKWLYTLVIATNQMALKCISLLLHKFKVATSFTAFQDFDVDEVKLDFSKTQIFKNKSY